jgi:hypothetical protein
LSNLYVGLIGLGVMGKNHLRVLSSLEQVDLVGVADPMNLEVMSRDSSYETYGDYRELLSQDLDYCVIAAPTGFLSGQGVAPSVRVTIMLALGRILSASSIPTVMLVPPPPLILTLLKSNERIFANI